MSIPTQSVPGTISPRKKLSLNKETLSSLSPIDLQPVNGGGTPGTVALTALGLAEIAALTLVYYTYYKAAVYSYYQCKDIPENIVAIPDKIASVAYPLGCAPDPLKPMVFPVDTTIVRTPPNAY